MPFKVRCRLQKRIDAKTKGGHLTHLQITYEFFLLQPGKLDENGIACCTDGREIMPFRDIETFLRKYLQLHKRQVSGEETKFMALRRKRGEWAMITWLDYESQQNLVSMKN